MFHVDASLMWEQPSGYTNIQKVTNISNSNSILSNLTSLNSNSTNDSRFILIKHNTITETFEKNLILNDTDS